MINEVLRRMAAAAAVAATLGEGANSSQTLPALTFTDISDRSGIRFVHNNGAAGDKWYPELFGGGVAVLDLEGDGRPDILFVNGRNWPEGGPPTRHGLYRNNGDGTFRDALVGSGFDTNRQYGLGAAVADYDNDGRDDVFMTAVDGGRLFHNEGSGRFGDVTARAGIRNDGFSVSAAWLDFDRDGLVDLFVGNYVRWSPALEVRCAAGGERGYCGPDAYKPAAPKLYRNRGGGRFDDVTVRAGLGEATDKAMGVAVLDYDGDGWPDIFVANDRVPAKLHRNNGRGGFTDVAVTAGVALSEHGVARANMGTDAADYDRSGHPDILVGNFLNEMLGLYRNTGRRTFSDVAPRSELGRSSLLSVTWAAFFFDADLDGWLDIFALNGGTDESQGMDARARLSQPPLLFRQRADHTFENLSPRVGAAFGRPRMGRGAAHADFDGDGDLDLVMTTLAGPASLLRNDADTGHWLRVRLTGSRSNRSGLGGRVTVTTAAGVQTQTVRSGSSYASQSDLVLTFGLAQDTKADRVDVLWPSGVSQSFRNVPANQLVGIDEGQGLRPIHRP